MKSATISTNRETEAHVAKLERANYDCIGIYKYLTCRYIESFKSHPYYMVVLVRYCQFKYKDMRVPFIFSLERLSLRTALWPDKS